MRRRYALPALPVLVLLTSPRASLPAQTISVGEIRVASFSPLASPEISTVIDLAFGATGDGQLDSATFIWSQAPCPAAVKIKFFRPDGRTLRYLEERGRYDVVAGSGAFRTVETVVLGPAVSVRRGDLIGITSLTSCGRPTVHEGGSYFVASGDVSQDVTLPAPVPGVSARSISSRPAGRPRPVHRSFS